MEELCDSRFLYADFRVDEDYVVWERLHYLLVMSSKDLVHYWVWQPDYIVN